MFIDGEELTIDDDQIQELVANAEAGAKFLDTKIPWWYRGVAINWLDMSLVDACVLGQVWPGGYGSFDESEETAEALGFYVSEEFFGCDENPPQTYEELDQMVVDAYKVLDLAWRSLIYERLDNG